MGESETAAADAAVAAWVEQAIGSVTHIERQARWRPAWFVHADGPDGPVELYVRGAREGFGGGTEPLTREAEVLRVLEAHAVPVPHVHGMVDEPPAIVMDRLPGRENLGHVGDERERREILAHYVEILVRMHAIDPAAFASAGLTVPEGPDALALGVFEGFVDSYRRSGAQPDPLLEFAIEWTRRNVPTHRADPRFLAVDSAQFMYDAGRVSGIIDLELAAVGDVAHDLGSFRIRDMSEPLGDIGAAYRRYEELSGEPLDLDAIDFHTIAWSLCTPLSLAAIVQMAPPLPELLQYVAWYLQYSLVTIEGIAQVLGVELDDVTLPEAAGSRHDPLRRALVGSVRALAADDDVARYRRDATASTAEYLRILAEHGAAVDAADLDDLAGLLGARPADWRTGDTELGVLVAASGPERDRDLVVLFHRRVMRQLLMLEPVSPTGPIRHLVPLGELLGD